MGTHSTDEDVRSTTVTSDWTAGTPSEHVYDQGPTPTTIDGATTMNADFSRIDLLPDQLDLFLRMTERYLAASAENRTFWVTETMGGTWMSQPSVAGEKIAVTVSQLRQLQYQGLVDDYIAGARTKQVDVTPFGVRYYEYVRTLQAGPITQVEDAMQSLIDGDEFRKRHPRAAASWDRAVALLWKAQDNSQVSEIGHHLREALQHFASEELDAAGVESPTETSKTITRLSEALTARRALLGETTIDALRQLIDWWKPVSRLVQKVEHANQQPDVNWEDARRATFLTLTVMYELSNAFGR
jgi:hypothetical protein